MIISRNDSSGGTEPKPGFYRDPSFEFMDSTLSPSLTLSFQTVPVISDLTSILAMYVFPLSRSARRWHP